MAVNVVIPFLIPLEENILNATRLLSGQESQNLFFDAYHYCTLVFEDTPATTPVVSVHARHNEGKLVRYSIVGGNQDGLFSVDQRNGRITVAAPLDHEIKSKHSLVVSAKSSDGEVAETTVDVRVADVNDNAPIFDVTELKVTAIEEDQLGLPRVIGQVSATDADWVDQNDLLYTLIGDGVDGYSTEDAFFSIDPQTGQVTQLRPLDRDPPNGKSVWKLRVKVHDGQSSWVTARTRVNQEMKKFRGHFHPSQKNGKYLNRNGVRKRRGVESPPEGNENKGEEEASINREKILKENDVIESNSAKDFVGNKKKFLDQIFIPRFSFESLSWEPNFRLPKLEKTFISDAIKVETPSEKLFSKSFDVGSRHKRNSPAVNKENFYYTQKGNKLNLYLNRYNPESSSLQFFYSQNFPDSEIPEDKLINAFSSSVFNKKHLSKFILSNSRRKRFAKFEKKLTKKRKRDRTKSNNWGFSSGFHIDNVTVSRNVKIPKRVPGSIFKKSSLSELKIEDSHKENIRVRAIKKETHLSANLNKREKGICHQFPRCLAKIKPEESKDYKRKLKKGSGRIKKRKFKLRNPMKFFWGNKSDHFKGFRFALVKTYHNLDELSQQEFQREIRHRITRHTTDYLEGSGDENCNLLDSLKKPLGSPQQARLKYLVSNLNKARNFRPKAEVHVVEADILIHVTDINDNPPVFPNTTIYCEVQENGPKDLFVATVTAWDADDPSSSTNAVLKYYLEKNAVDERNGSPIFRINPDTGEIRTSLCCLDRESTFEYQLQVVATDGGGLKGTGTVAVRLSDVNDNSPRFARREWKVLIDETPSPSTLSSNLTLSTDTPLLTGPPVSNGNDTLFEITVNDPDTSNYFLFRVVKFSGWGWDHFDIRTSGSVGQVFALKPLDFEDEMQRRGFRFLVEVTDRGTWKDLRHVESAWVEVTLKDVNDNPPVFQKNLIHVTVREDVPPNTFISQVSAVDPDQNGEGPVSYNLIDDWGNLHITENGEIRTRSNLDREGRFGSRGLVRIVAVDKGMPPRSSTATLIVIVTDVNDCPPRIIGMNGLHVQENVGPTKVGTLLATDDDIWALGHGPPFTFHLHQQNSLGVFEKFDLKYMKELDSGRGGAEIWTREPLDREENRAVVMKIIVKDAANLSSTNDVIIVVDDVNDNDMKPGNKIIYLWKTQGTGLEASIGRLFVDDPDDWDSGDKKYEWGQIPHPYFDLDEVTGDIKASPHLREGRYDLHFKVSDEFREQKDVAANVTVEVKVLSPRLLSHAVPITFSPISAPNFTYEGFSKSNHGKLGKLKLVLLEILSPEIRGVEIVSVSDGVETSREFRSKKTNQKILEKSQRRLSTTIWISANERNSAGLMAASKLRGLLEIRKEKIEAEMNLKVDFDEAIDADFFPEIPSSFRQFQSSSPFTLSSSLSASSEGESPASLIPSVPLLSPSSSLPFDLSNLTKYPASNIEMPVTSLPLQVVDTNQTSLVTPLLSRFFSCRRNVSNVAFEQHRHKYFDRNRYLGCDMSTCLNAGKCVPTEVGSKCFCPGSTWGGRCKTLVRSFAKDGFAWLEPLSPCFPLIISFKFLTNKKNGVLLYSGPLTDGMGSSENREKTQFYNVKDVPRTLTRGSANTSSNWSSSSLLVLQLSDSNLQMLLAGDSIGSIKLELKSNSSFADGKWHTVHSLVDEKGASLMSDLCTAGWTLSTSNSSHCFDQIRWVHNVSDRYPWKVPWQISLPLQLGGLAHDAPNYQSHGWEYPIEKESMIGCIKALRVNDELLDLGEVSFSRQSDKGCQSQESVCAESNCAPWGYCTGGLEKGSAYCFCYPGYSGKDCKETTEAFSLKTGKFVRFLFDFTPDPFKAKFQLKVKTLSRNTTIMKMASKDDSYHFHLYIHEGVVCLDFIRNSSEPKDPPKTKKDEMKELLTPAPYEEQIPESKIQSKIEELGTKIKESISPSKTEESEKELVMSDEGDLSVCLTYFDISDGVWHVLQGGRFGPNVILEVDDAEGVMRNESLVIMKGDIETILIPEELWINAKEGVLIGDVMYNERISEQPFPSREGKICLEDVRLFGRPLPLSSSSNVTGKWARTNSALPFEKGCGVFHECENLKCHSSESCSSRRKFLDCGCPMGKTPTSVGCKKFDPCLYVPCLHGGSCSSPNGDINCTCTQSFIGNYCQWELRKNDDSLLTEPLLAIAIALVFLILALCGGIIWRCVYLRRREVPSTSSGRGSHSNSPEGSPFKLKLSETGGVDEGGEGKDDPGIQIKMVRAIEGSFVINERPESIRLNSLSLRIDESVAKVSNESPVLRDDLRAYAYEGDGSSAGSLGSAKSGFKEEFRGAKEEILPLNSIIQDVVDLLKDLPDGCNSSLKRKTTLQPLCSESSVDSPYSATNNKTMSLPRKSFQAVKKIDSCYRYHLRSDEITRTDITL